MVNRITRQFKKVKPRVAGEVECIECGLRWDVERDGTDIKTAKKEALAMPCPRRHRSKRIPKTKLGTMRTRRCADCTTRRWCTWDICPHEAEVGGETDPARAMWLCEDCMSVRAEGI